MDTKKIMLVAAGVLICADFGIAFLASSLLLHAGGAVAGILAGISLAVGLREG